jgi:uncharacterized membrane protein YedE/YeeE
VSEETTVRTPRASGRAGGKKKKKKNQLPVAFVLLLVVIGVAIWLNFFGESLALYWITGIAFGVILQRSRFCFTASLRDPYLTGSTSVTKAVLIAFAVTSIGFTAIKYGFASQGLAIPGQSYVAPVSVATGAGALMFGIGMVIAGGCASGTLMRVGEGFWMQVISLFFFIVGSLLGSFNYGWWERNFIVSAPRIFLPDYLGWMGGLLANLALIAVIFWIAHKWGKRKKDEA